MLTNDEMAKALSKLSHDERMGLLWRDVDSPASVARADELLTLIANEWLDALAFRERAAARHNDSTAPPEGPFERNRATRETAIAPVANTKETASAEPGKTLRDLINAYRSSTASPYLKLRHGTKGFYDHLIRRILADAGETKISKLNSQEKIMALYNSWGGDEKPISHALITMVRSSVNFCAIELKDAEADRLSVTLHRMRFSPPKARNVHLMPEQVIAIRAKAHEMGRPSIALAQSLQFELGLQQKDTIGEYVPLDEPGESEVIYESEKWMHGLLWSEIDSDLVLRHRASRNQKMIEIRLSDYPMVMEELNLIGPLPKVGPVIVSEKSGRPWVPGEFRRWWRKIATAVGVPDAVRNSDSRTSNDASVGKPAPASTDTDALDLAAHDTRH